MLPAHDIEASFHAHSGILAHELNFLLLALDQELHGLHRLDGLQKLLISVVHFLHGGLGLAAFLRISPHSWARIRGVRIVIAYQGNDLLVLGRDRLLLHLKGAHLGGHFGVLATFSSLGIELGDNVYRCLLLLITSGFLSVLDLDFFLPFFIIFLASNLVILFNK